MDPKDEKVCSKCGVVKAKTEFSRRPERACGTRSRCKECERPRYRNWCANNRELAREQGRRYYRGKGKLRLTNLRKNSLNYKILDNLRRRINKAVRNGSKSQSTVRLLGCSLTEFRMYLESKFDVGMSWENYGKFGWHIDHIMPCAVFDLSRPDHQKRCFHFSNMQPMWAADNIRKHAKVSSNQFNLL